MGAWGSGNLQNDTALDFVGDYEHGGAGTVSDIFAAVEEVGGYLDADVACSALAAAEIVAASFGKGLDGLPPESAAELVAHAEEVRRLPGVVEQALASVDVITRSPEASELYSLWQEAGADAEWLSAVSDLRSRLEGVAP